MANALEMVAGPKVGEIDEEGYETVGYKNPLEKSGDEVKGTYIGVVQSPVKGKATNHYQVEQDNGEILLVRSAHQLDQFFSAIKVGDDVKIRRLNEEKKGSHGRVTDYDTRVKRPAR
jgi:hypothetical protein